jgi:hypothetical protein
MAAIFVYPDIEYPVIAQNGRSITGFVRISDPDCLKKLFLNTQLIKACDLGLFTLGRCKIKCRNCRFHRQDKNYFMKTQGGECPNILPKYFMNQRLLSHFKLVLRCEKFIGLTFGLTISFLLSQNLCSV